MASATLQSLRNGLCVLALCGLIFPTDMLAWSPLHSSAAIVKTCSPSFPEGHGNATSKNKAKRNARIKLERNLDRKFPGDSKRFLRGGIEYQCKKSVLWLCAANTKVCN